MPSFYEMTVEDFASVCGTTIDDIPQDIQDFIHATDFGYRKLSQKDRDQVILKILKKLDSGSLPRVGKERRVVWEKVWSQTAEDFRRGNYDLQELVPNYIDTNPIVRLNRDFVAPSNARFERNFSHAFRSWLFEKHLRSVGAIYEFGCGSGMNLATLGKLYPEKRLYGLDWTQSAVDLVNLVGKSHGLRLRGCRLDLFDPDEDLVLEENSAVVTMCALEQMGNNHEAFIQFLLDKSPALCLNMEPLCDLYDEDHLVDHLAIRYHRQRGYLEGYVGRLRQLEQENRIEIQKTQRVLFGSLYHEAYSFVIWRPMGRNGT